MPATQQLLLDLVPPPVPSLDNFITGRNTELLHALRALSMTAAKERLIYLWGEPGSGRSHLLRALSLQARYGDAAGMKRSSCVWDEAPGSPRLWAIDNVESASPEMQIALFNLINEVRAHADAAIVLAGCAAPLQLNLREDLRSRLGWGLVFQVHGLNDAEKEAALILHADERGLKLPADVRQYLLTHFTRDMPSLMALIEALEKFAMERKRALTLPLLREFIQNHHAEI